MSDIHLLNTDGEDLIYEVAGDAVRGNPLDIVCVATCHTRETVDGVKFEGKETAKRMADCWNAHAALIAERDKLAKKLRRLEREDAAARCHKKLTAAGVPDGNDVDGWPGLDERVMGVVDERDRLRAALDLIAAVRRVSGPDGVAFHRNLRVAIAALAGADLRKVEVAVEVAAGTWKPEAKEGAR